MYGKYREKLKHELKEITQSGLYKSERLIKSAQQGRIKVGENQVLNMCANNYLGLANNSEIINAVKAGLDERGFGMASVRFICGTQDIHSELEKKISHFFGTDDTILYSSCFDANAGLFETLLPLPQHVRHSTARLPAIAAPDNTRSAVHRSSIDPLRLPLVVDEQ